MLFIALGVVFRQLKRGLDGVDKRGWIRRAWWRIRTPPLMARTDIGIVPWPENNRDFAPAVLKGIISHLKARDGGHFAYRGPRIDGALQSGVEETLRR